MPIAMQKIKEKTNQKPILDQIYLNSNLTEKEKKLLKEISSKSGIPILGAVKLIFYHNASPMHLESLMQSGDVKEAQFLKKISEPFSDIGQYRVIKKQYLSLVEKIRKIQKDSSSAYTALMTSLNIESRTEKRQSLTEFLRQQEMVYSSSQGG